MPTALSCLVAERQLIRACTHDCWKRALAQIRWRQQGRGERIGVPLVNIGADATGQHAGRCRLLLQVQVGSPQPSSSRDALELSGSPSRVACMQASAVLDRWGASKHGRLARTSASRAARAVRTLAPALPVDSSLHPDIAWDDRFMRTQAQICIPSGHCGGHPSSLLRCTNGWLRYAANAIGAC
jgi:hypothetical protein